MQWTLGYMYPFKPCFSLDICPEWDCRIMCSVAQFCLTLCGPPGFPLLSMEFSRQEYWRGLLLPTPGALPDTGIEPRCLVSPALPGDSLPLAPSGKPPAGSYGSFIFSIWGTSILFSVVAVPIYIPTSSAQGFPFLYILAMVSCHGFCCCLLFSH